jgi:hypothetical protein
MTSILSMTMGCAPVSPPANSEENVRVVGGESASCDADRARSLIGRPASSGRGAEAQRLTGGRGIRWIQPGQAVTMDYRPDRINIELDAKNRVVRIACG